MSEKAHGEKQLQDEKAKKTLTQVIEERKANEKNDNDMLEKSKEEVKSSIEKSKEERKAIQEKIQEERKLMLEKTQQERKIAIEKSKAERKSALEKSNATDTGYKHGYGAKLAEYEFKRKMIEKNVLDMMKEHREDGKLAMEKAKAELKAIKDKINALAEKINSERQAELEKAKAAREQTKK